MTASKFCLIAAGLFFMSGLLTGIWKFLCIMRSPQGVAPTYVDITHRTSLMYAFSCLLLREFVPYSPLDARGTLWAAAVPILFFASAVFTYIVHGVLRDTDNQLQRPFRLGNGTLKPALIWVYMVALIAGEIGGFAILLVGAFQA
ncbi:MAG TPA: hypothetical protein H9903_13630 [Candidatus Aquabacterium excrementipullorum]|nr:hypothetical protein [Candidatus Aquabacterium excrementipullorum]